MTATRSVHDVWLFFLVEGIVMILFGAVAIALPPLAGIAVVILLGWLLIGSGLFGFVTALMGRHAPGFVWSLLSALVTFAAGVMLFAWPLGGVVSLSLALAAFLGLDGALSIALGLEHRRHLTPRWLWLIVNGLADLLFAGIILVWLPGSAPWALGLILGIDMLIGGATLLAMALDARHA
jgi:uncharacterized membrane protein HdeD (DUF308 family)